METRRVTFVFRQGQLVRWAESPQMRHYVCQRRWTERDIMAPLVEYGVTRSADGRGGMTWVVEADLEAWDGPGEERRLAHMARQRRRENAGSSPNSWKKHSLMGCAAKGQAYAYRYTHPTAHGLIIDMHAGTGEGIDLPQLDFFKARSSFATASLAVQLAAKLGQCEVVLCEKNRRDREQLAERFPDATILPDHEEAPNLIRAKHRWALVLNDPCGYASHGISTMETIASLIATDWVIAFNEGGLGRILGMEPAGEVPEHPFVANVRRAREQYLWMAEPHQWAQRLGARHMARSVLIPGSAAFRYRILVLSHTLSQTLRPPTWENVL